MKSAKNLIAGLALITGLVGLAAPASAAWYHDSDRKDLDRARQELRHDLRRGADSREIARDRAAIARERREVFRRAFVHHLSDTVGHRTINDMRMPRHPTDIGGAPEHVVIFHVKNPFIRQSDAGEIPPGCVYDPF